MRVYREVDPKYGENRHAELRWTVPMEPDREAALNVLSTYRRLVLMGAEDSYKATLDAIVDALGIGGDDE